MLRNAVLPARGWVVPLCYRCSNGQDGNGTWTLFVADFSPGGLAKLSSWTLEVSPVPEPLETGLAAGLLLVVGFGYRKLRAHRETR